jgi:hypothetical protein
MDIFLIHSLPAENLVEIQRSVIWNLHPSPPVPFIPSSRPFFYPENSELNYVYVFVLQIVQLRKQSHGLFKYVRNTRQ